MIREGATPIPEHRQPPVAFNHNEIVALVKEVLGELREIEAGRSYAMTFSGGNKGIVVRFVCGTRIVGNYIIPFPIEILALLGDRDKNPYEMLGATFRATSDMSGLMMVKTESISEDV